MIYKYEEFITEHKYYVGKLEKEKKFYKEWKSDGVIFKEFDNKEDAQEYKDSLNKSTWRSKVFNKEEMYKIKK